MMYFEGKTQEEVNSFFAQVKYYNDYIRQNGKACKEDKSAAYTEFVRERAKEVWENGFVDINFLSEAVSGIKIYKDGRIAVEFINGTEVFGKEAKNDAAEDSDEDRSKSLID